MSVREERPESVMETELREMRESYVDEEYGIITGKSERAKLFSSKERKERIRKTLAELFDAKRRIDVLESKVSRLTQENESLYSRHRDDLETIEELKGKKKPVKKEPVKKEEDSDSDEEDEFVMVQRIKYLVVDESVVDLKTGREIGEMKDGKVVFNKDGTANHKRRVKQLKK